MSAFSLASPAAHFQIVSIGEALGLKDFHLDLWWVYFRDEANSTDLIRERSQAVLGVRP